MSRFEHRTASYPKFAHRGQGAVTCFAVPRDPRNSCFWQGLNEDLGPLPSVALAIACAWLRATRPSLNGAKIVGKLINLISRNWGPERR